MKKRLVQVLIIFICVSTFFIVKDDLSSNNPFKKLEEGPDSILYIKWAEGNNGDIYLPSKDDKYIEQRKEIVDYLKSVKYKKIRYHEKLMENRDELYWFRYYRLAEIGNKNSELLSEMILINYIVMDEKKYFIIKSYVEHVKSGTYEIVSDFDNERIIELLSIEK